MGIISVLISLVFRWFASLLLELFKILYGKLFFLVDINGLITLCLAADKSSLTRKLKHDVIEGVNQLIHEIAGCHEQIAEQAIEHIHQKYFSFL